MSESALKAPMHTSPGQRPISANLRGARGELRRLKWGCRVRLMRTAALEIKMALGAAVLLIPGAKAIL